MKDSKIALLKRLRLPMIFLGLAMVVTPAYAYIDPGSSMLLLQGLLAFVAGVVAFFRNPFAFISKIYRRLTNKNK